LDHLRPSQARMRRPMRLGVEWIYVPSANYYRVKNEWTWLLPIVRAPLTPRGYDYFLLSQQQRLDEMGLELVRRYETSGLLIGHLSCVGDRVIELGSCPTPE
jgi:hypothetical protein